MPEGLEPVLLTHFAPDEPARPTESAPAPTIPAPRPTPRPGRGRHRKPRLPARPARKLIMVAAVTFVVAGGTGVLIAIQLTPSARAIPATDLPGQHHAAVNGPGRVPLAAVAASPTSTAGPAPAPTTAPAIPTQAPAAPLAPPPPPVPTTTAPAQPAMPAAGQPCSTPGGYAFDSHYVPLQCRPSGPGTYTWQVMWP